MQRYYTTVENELIEYIMNNVKKAAQIKIILCIVRFTNGFHRNEAMLSTSFIAKYTGLSERTVLREIGELEAAGAVVRRTDKERNIKVLSMNPGLYDMAEGVCDIPSRDGTDSPSSDIHDTPPSDGSDTQEIYSYKYNNISNKDCKETHAPNLNQFSPYLKCSIEDWAQVHNLNKRELEAFIRIADKYSRMYGEKEVAQVIDQCMSEGRNAVYFDRLKEKPKCVNNDDLELFTWGRV